MLFFVIMGALIGAFFVFFLFLVVSAFAPDLSKVITPVVISVLKDVAGPVAAGFGGAIAGAVCSYLFQRKIEREKETKADISAIHKSSIHLMMKLNELYSIKKHNIYPSLEHKLRFLDISKIPSAPNITDRVDPRVIDVALSVKDALTIDTIYLAEARYRACFENFINRNSGLDEYRASVKQSGLGREGGHTIKELYRVVGEGQLVALHMMTEQMIEVLDETLQSLNQAVTLLNDMVAIKYKGQDVVGLRFDITENEKYLVKSPPPHFNVESLVAFLRRFDEP
ncbi:hypothetical protein [Pseudomonas proteolytica]|uniref:hypothetical protein n=1 Tax=Pseudomonas proteolytica TaxID=219574 RepID=UPI001474EE7D|nr:hypothetical protein [Pseudomonas proteolytica]NMY95643.1 hypothetical protein [Pseudomonas proteolytica]